MQKFNDSLTLLWSGCWETRPERIICRWILAWVPRKQDVAGCIAGYSGGGAFQCEKFVILGQEIYLECDDDLSILGDQTMISDTEDCLDKVLSFHQEEVWESSETLLLRSQDALGEITLSEDLILAGVDHIPIHLSELFKRVGLISRPNFFPNKKEA